MSYEPKIDTQLHYHGDVVCSFINTFFYTHQVFSVVLTSFTESLAGTVIQSSALFHARIKDNAREDTCQCLHTFFTPRCRQACHPEDLWKD
jgi:hypothetical protein